MIATGNFFKYILKFTAFILSVIVFVFCFYSLYAEKTPVFYCYASEYELYFKSGSFGSGVVGVAEKDFGGYAEIKGESCFVSVSYERVLKDFNATHIFSEKTEYGESFYAYSPLIKYKTFVGGKRVNIHYYKCDDYVKLGTPIIFGGY